MDNFDSDTIFMIVKMVVSLFVIVGIPVIVSRVMKKKGASEFNYQAIPIIILLALAAVFWFVVKDMIF